MRLRSPPRACLLLAGLLVARLAAARRSARTLAHALDGARCKRCGGSRRSWGAGGQCGECRAGRRTLRTHRARQAWLAWPIWLAGRMRPMRPMPRTRRGHRPRAALRPTSSAHGGMKACSNDAPTPARAGSTRRLAGRSSRRRTGGFSNSGGFVDARARGLFLMARIAGAIVPPLVAGPIAHAHVDGPRYVLVVIVAFMLRRDGAEAGVAPARGGASRRGRRRIADARRSLAPLAGRRPLASIKAFR